MNILPLLISIPHGGTLIPEDIKDNVCLSDLDLLDDSDAFTIEIYDIGHKAQNVIKSDIRRAIVDLNRSLDQRPPDHPDGIIKSHTCYGKEVYQKEKPLNLYQIDLLIRSYYLPFHETLKNALIDMVDTIKLALDCHSMAAIGPEISNDYGKNRPLMCLGNLWGQTSSHETMQHLADCFSRSFNINRKDISMNVPFAGGYITKTYGKQTIPWIQVEMSRELYLVPPYFDRETLTMDKNRLKELNEQFLASLVLYFNEI